MEKFEKLIESFNNKTARIGVVGLGYVGLPLSVEKAKAGYNVLGFDVQESKVDKVNRGENYIGDIIPEDLKELVFEKKLSATSDFNKMNELNAITICVPTPLDIYKQPNMEYVKASTEKIAQNIKEDTLIVLESTTYPGTTEELIKPILEKYGFIVGENVFLAYSPERVDPGNAKFKTKNTPKVVGGVTSRCTELAATLYRNVLESSIHEVSSPSVAEMEKLLENTFRNINVALANEMAILCHKMDIDVWEVIDAAATKPYGFMAFYPGPGLGGHCIPIDPWYLTYKAREHNYHTKLIEIAGEINDSMPQFVIDRSMKILNEYVKPLNGSNITILGVAYKKDIDDYRESPVLEIIKSFIELGAKCTVVDSCIEEFKINNKLIKTEPLDKDLLESSDLVILATDHSQFDKELIVNNSEIILDCRNFLPNADNIYKL